MLAKKRRVWKVKGMARTKPWEVPDELWAKVKPLIPERKERDPNRVYKRKAGGGRPPADPRLVFAAIVRVLRTGCQWNSLTKKRDGVASSSVHRHFQQWMEAGVFLEMWRLGLSEYDGLEGINWKWQAVDGSTLKAPLAQEAVGPNPTDRGKKWKQNPFVVRREWHPDFVFRERGEPARRERAGTAPAEQSALPRGSARGVRN